jgi:hypothetical protein
MSQVGRHASSRLIPVLRGLGEQFHDGRRERPRQAGSVLGGRHGATRDMAVHQLHRVRGGKRQLPGEHLVQRDAQGIQIAARVDRAVHAAGLLGGHVGQRAGDYLRRFGGRVLAQQAGRDAEACQPRLARRRVREDVGRLYVLMEQTARVELPERDRQPDGDVQERRYLPGGPQEMCQEYAARVCKDERRPPLVVHQRQGARSPGGLQRLTQSIGVCQPLQALWCRLRHDRGHRQERGQLRIPHTAGQDVFPLLPERLELIA